VTTRRLTRVVRLESRACENCGGVRFDPLWRQQVQTWTREAQYIFDVNNVICGDCGFVFVSPVFAEEDLTGYYRNSFAAYEKAEPDYSIENRLKLIDSLSVGADVFIDIGSNRTSQFHKLLHDRFRHVHTVELNSSVNREHESLNSLSANCADVVSHYFVLEHVPRVRLFLAQCNSALRAGGVMVCEVPDIAVYPYNPAALELHEHANHFSVTTLQQIAGAVGFRMLSVSHELCSRSFGFAAVFCKDNSNAVPVRSLSEYAANRNFFERGLERLAILRAEIDASAALAADYDRSGEPLVFWAANELLSQFLARHPLPNGAVVVDSNPEKARFLDGFDVISPELAVDALLKAGAIFIFTRFHAEAILSQINDLCGRTFPSARIHIVDTFGQ
jgi:hypothetical protein